MRTALVALLFLAVACGDVGPVGHHATDHCPRSHHARGWCEAEPEPIPPNEECPSYQIQGA